VRLVLAWTEFRGRALTLTRPRRAGSVSDEEVEGEWLRGRTRQLKRHVSRGELQARASGSLARSPSPRGAREHARDPPGVLAPAGASLSQRPAGPGVAS
jgi:hypothetical protein